MHEFWVKVVNRGADPSEFKLRGTTDGDPNYTVQYLVDDIDVTADVAAGAYRISGAGGSSMLLVVRVTVGAGAPIGSKRRVLVRATSLLDPDRTDIVKAVVSR